MLFSPKASGMEHHVPDAGDRAAHGRGRPTTSSTGWASCFPSTSPPSPSCRRRPTATLDGVVAELRRYGRASSASSACNLNPDPSGHLGLAADHRRVLVPAVRGVGGARRPGDGARLDGVQPELPHPRRALPQRRHVGVHAARRCRPVRAVPHAASRDPARRRRGALPLGPLPRAGRARLGRPDPAALCCATSSSTPASTTRPGIDLLHRRDPGGQRPLRLGDARRGARRGPGDRHRRGTTRCATSSAPVSATRPRHAGPRRATPVGCTRRSTAG